MKDEVAVWWIRRDLRLIDNQALTAAGEQGEQIVPLFVIDPVLWRSPYVGPKRTTFLLDGLRRLDKALRERGGRLIVRRGEPRREVAAIMRETGAKTIFAEEDVSPYARRRDAALGAEVNLRLTPGLTILPPGVVRKQDGDPYTVFTPFSKAWFGHASPTPDDLDRVPDQISVPSNLASQPIPTQELPEDIAFVAGEGEAQQRLLRFTQGDKAPIFQYAQQRDLPAANATSSLSPYLRLGMLSARQAVVAAQEALARASNQNGHEGVQAWINELVWREFYINILYHFPQVRRGNFRTKYDGIAWENDGDKLEAWQNGRTGYPFVDAGMRQLIHSGWMHNRVRMITASFLTKDLLIDWRYGERWFMQHLVDGDPAANNGGWQWAAGTGTDAAPYFRIFNPITQSKKFDPQGTYIRRWLPELQQVPQRYIHEPWLMPSEVQRDSGCRIGKQYPPPIVDHAAARKRALAMYKAATE
jgi:deoxyribodipyrimidine photo-lyase